MVVTHRLNLSLASATGSNDRKPRLVRAELGNVGVEDDFDPPPDDGCVQFAFVVFEHSRKGLTAIAEHDVVALRQRQRRLNGTVPAANHENVLIFVQPGAVQTVVDLLPILTRYAELARIAPLADGDDHPPGPN